MSKLARFTLDSKRFDIFKEMMLRRLRNFKAEQPYTHAMYYCEVILQSVIWTRQQLADALEGELVYDNIVCMARIFLVFHPQM